MSIYFNKKTPSRIKYCQQSSAVNFMYFCHENMSSHGTGRIRGYPKSYNNVANYHSRSVMIIINLFHLITKSFEISTRI